MKASKCIMRVGVVGINHKLAELHLREILARICQKRFGAGQSTHGHHAFILLSTCNRMELYFSSQDLPETHSYLLNVLKQEIEEEFDQKLYSYFGQECFNHLATVTAGLDSAIIAETEIQGQVKQAYEATLGYCNLPSPLHYLFQKSLKISKTIRDKYALGRGMPNLEDAILHVGINQLNKPLSSTVLFIGASDINQKILTHFQRKGVANITLCNRSTHKGEAVSARFQIPFLPWNELYRWPQFDWIILGTKAPHYLIKKEDLLTPSSEKKLIIDLSFPRNVDPEIPLPLLNVDQINHTLMSHRKLLSSALAQAQQEIQQAVQLHTELYHAKQSFMRTASAVA